MRLDQRSALWIGREHQNNLTLVVQTRDQLLRLPQLELPNSGRGFTAVRMGDNQFAYLTSNRAVTGSDLHETSALAKVHVTCK